MKFTGDSKCGEYSAARDGGKFFGVLHADNAGVAMDNMPDGQSQQAVYTTKAISPVSLAALDKSKGEKT